MGHRHLLCLESHSLCRLPPHHAYSASMLHLHQAAFAQSDAQAQGYTPAYADCLDIMPARRPCSISTNLHLLRVTLRLRLYTSLRIDALLNKQKIPVYTNNTLGFTAAKDACERRHAQKACLALW